MLNLEEDATLTDASSKLLEAEASQGEIPKEAFEQTDEKLQQSEAPLDGDGITPKESPSDTPAEAEPKPPTEDKTETEPKRPEAKSKFTKANERLEKTWKAVTAEKEALTKQKSELTQRETAIAQREQQVQIKLAKASQKYTPEQYEARASQQEQSVVSLLLQVRGLKAQAQEHEDNGEHGKAELAKQQAQDLEDQANGEKYSIKQLRGLAKSLRENPDPTLQQIQAKNQQAIQAYTIEAAKKWPDLAKEGSEFQKTMVGHLQAAKQQGLDETEFPIIRYHIARLTAAETEAARVPDLVKKLGVAEARVKELESLTAPGGGQGSVQRIPEKKTTLTDAEEESELRSLAHSLS